MKKCAKVITICGSLKFKNEMMKQAISLELEGNCVLTVVYPIDEDKNCLTNEQMELLGKMHKQRIDMADCIFVVNVGGYIGNNTKSEIEYAKASGKEILYLEQI